MPTMGDRVWVFDTNRRVYGPPPRRAPIYREHFLPMRLVGETHMSWIVAPVDEMGREWARIKFAKDTQLERVPPNVGGTRRSLFLSDAAMEDDVWAHGHRGGIFDALRRCDATTLRRVAEVVGYAAHEVDDAG